MCVVIFISCSYLYQCDSYRVSTERNDCLDEIQELGQHYRNRTAAQQTTLVNLQQVNFSTLHVLLPNLSEIILILFISVIMPMNDQASNGIWHVQVLL